MLTGFRSWLTEVQNTVSSVIAEESARLTAEQNRLREAAEARSAAQRKEERWSIPLWTVWPSSRRDVLEAPLRARILALSRSRRTYMTPLPANADASDAAAYGEEVPNEAINALSAIALRLDLSLQRARYLLVPRKLTEKVFWRRYLYRVDQVRKEMLVESIYTIPAHESRARQKDFNDSASAALAMPLKKYINKTDDDFDHDELNRYLNQQSDSDDDTHTAAAATTATHNEEASPAAAAETVTSVAVHDALLSPPTSHTAAPAAIEPAASPHPPPSVSVSSASVTVAAAAVPATPSSIVPANNVAPKPMAASIVSAPNVVTPPLPSESAIATPSVASSSPFSLVSPVPVSTAPVTPSRAAVVAASALIAPATQPIATVAATHDDDEVDLAELESALAELNSDQSSKPAASAGKAGTANAAPGSGESDLSSFEDVDPDILAELEKQL